MKKRLFVYTLLFLLTSAQNAWSQRGFFMPMSKNKVEIPFEYNNNFIIITLKMNHGLSLRFIFDTGAEHTILTKREIGDVMRVQYEQTFRVMGADMKTELIAYLARNVRLEIPDKLIAPQEDILVLDEDYFQFEEYAGVEVHGILSGNSFARYLIKINYDRKIITLYEKNSFKPRDHEGFEEFPLLMYHNKPYLDLPLAMLSDSVAQVRLLLDTGAGMPLLLFTNTHPLLHAPPNALRSNIGMGLGGYLEGFAGRISGLKIGALEQRNVITYFQPVDSLQLENLLRASRNGLIGNELLSRFQIIFDYNGEKIWLKPGKNYNSVFTYDRSGMSLLASGLSLNSFIVQAVLPNTPAAEAGIQSGDEILKVGRVPALLMTMSGVLKIFQDKPGKQIKITIKRDGQKIKKVIVLRDLV